MNKKNIKKKPYIFFFLAIIFLFNRPVASLDDSDVLIDRVFMTAVKKSNYNKVEEMLDKDAAVNYKDSENLVALSYALLNDDRKMFDLLVAGGANTKVTILNKTSLLIHYVNNQKYSLIEDLVKSGVNLNFQDKLGMTALMHSIEKGNVNAVNLLIRENFDKDLTDFSGKTIFDYADSSRNLLIKKLIKNLNTSN
tara:strand:- start:128 stop:712 length:585 start_codon:yes stop_codon:yes gene_type:complete